ncbi:unnamed protein product [Symbiodinium sp. CCMP2592]|nr:unnamed protein product [Symbiodinium sp. CCMP2592]
MERWPLLQARVLETSSQRLRLCEVRGHGRCLEAQVACTLGQCLAEERPLVLGSSDGSWLAKACCVNEEEELDAMDDLLAGCLCLHVSSDVEKQQLAQELSRESSSVGDTSEDRLSICLSSHLLEALGPDVAPILSQWRACCDVNAETWIETVEESEPTRPLIRHVRFLFGLFAALAMVQHSCQPNARVEWDSSAQAMKLVAMSDIACGQRISRSYLDAGLLMAPTSVRKVVLQQDWGFQCTCLRCRCSLQEVDWTDVMTPFLPDQNSDCQTGPRLTLQRCAGPFGLKLDPAAVQAIRRAGAACQALGVPPVGTLHFLQDVVSDVQPGSRGSLSTITLCLPGVCELEDTSEPVGNDAVDTVKKECSSRSHSGTRDQSSKHLTICSLESE